jgi:hypothetical protein
MDLLVRRFRDHDYKENPPVVNRMMNERKKRSPFSEKESPENNKNESGVSVFNRCRELCSSFADLF